MKNIMISKILIILTLICLGFNQDEYPYFSNPSKQLKFEQRKINTSLIQDVKNNEIEIPESEYIIMNPPYYSQHYNNEVLKNLVESYNIIIYKEILDNE